MAENQIRSSVSGGLAVPSVRVVAAYRGIVTVSVAGDLDTLGAPVLERALNRIWSGDVRRMTLDLSRVEFAGVAALRTLLRASATARRHGADLRLVAHRGHIVRLLTDVGLGELLDGPPAPRAGAAERLSSADPAARGCTVDRTTSGRKRTRLPGCPTG